MSDALMWFWPELRANFEQCVVIEAGRMHDGIAAISDETLIATINARIAEGKKCVIFDNSRETIRYQELLRVHTLLPHLNIDVACVYYVTGSLDAVDIYKVICEANAWTPVNMVVFNMFSNLIKGNIADHATEYSVRNRAKTFLCMNRIPRPHRVCLLGLLHEKNLINDSSYSFYDHEYGKSPQCGCMVNEHLSPALANNVLESIEDLLPMLPLRLTLDEDDGNPIELLPDDVELFRNTYFSLIPETYFFKNSFLNEHNSMFLTEKTFNAILMKHPFVIAGMPDSMAHLRNLGYKSFHPFIDETYDAITDDEERLIAIVNEVERLSRFTDEQWIEWQIAIKNIVEYNYDVLINSALGPLNTVSLSKE